MYMIFKQISLLLCLELFLNFSYCHFRQVYMIENAHGQHVRDLDFNPNKQYHLVSCGDDCRTKFWDVRNPSQPVKVVSEHSHW